MFTCIDVKFIFDSVRLGLSSSANILQMSPSELLSSCCFCRVFLLSFRLVPAAVLTLETSEMSAFFFSQPKQQPRLQVFSVTVP